MPLVADQVITPAYADLLTQVGRLVNDYTRKSLDFYWHLGRAAVTMRDEAIYGKRTINQFAKDLAEHSTLRIAYEAITEAKQFHKNFNMQQLELAKLAGLSMRSAYLLSRNFIPPSVRQAILEEAVKRAENNPDNTATEEHIKQLIVQKLDTKLKELAAKVPPRDLANAEALLHAKRYHTLPSKIKDCESMLEKLGELFLEMPRILSDVKIVNKPDAIEKTVTCLKNIGGLMETLTVNWEHINDNVAEFIVTMSGVSQDVSSDQKQP